VAILGYAAASNQLPVQTRSGLNEDLIWLGRRSWFRPHQPRTLEADGIAALGVALAMRQSDVSDGAEWLRDLVVRSAATFELPELDRTFFTAAAHVIAAPGRQDTTIMMPEARVAFAEYGIGCADECCYSDAWARILHFTAGDGNLLAATLLLRALDLLTQRNMPARWGRLEPRDVLHVLEGVPRSLRRWAWDTVPRTSRSGLARWTIDNEYHVQNLLWAVLAPLFPDLNDEETLPPVGQKNPRVDLSIPSLGTIVEVKFIRPTTRFQDVIEELAADSSLYRTDPRWTALIPFVWDDSRRSEEHSKLVEGLNKLPLVVGAVAMGRPGKMGHEKDI
jgi:hypothetical protein